MGITVKSILEKEPPNYKKAFLVSLMVVLLISSLAIGMFTGQAMGQSENDNEPLSTARFTGSVIVTIVVIILIIALVRLACSRITAKIDPNEIKPLPSMKKRIFLSLITLNFYLPYFYAEYIAKLNVMSMYASKKSDSIKPINFSTAFFVILWSIFLFPVIFAFVHGFLLNPVVYTAIFNLDFPTLFMSIVGGFDEFRLLSYNLLSGSEELLICLVMGWIFCFAVSLIYVGRTIKRIPQTSKALLTHYANKYYMENPDYYNECAVMLNKYANIRSSEAIAQTEEAFKKLIKYHNEGIYTQQTHGRDRTREF